MDSALPLLALSLLGALTIPPPAVAQRLPDATPEALAKAVQLPPAPPQSGTSGKPSSRTLTGSVVDEWGKPLMGATVMVVGEKEHSVSTNSEGNYLLPTTAATPVIQVSFAGYQSAERVVRGPADLLFKLEPVQGYKRDLKKRSKAATKAWKH
ncbi:hypothetical protein HNQ93_001304 [Hymenobacter luteus]|uniref:Carboxypeptidase regulatory-like domain-containing protein n=2 Tax=Hymenobacter TaxID=89966 RepID=A0A7W9T0J1_9BACT|nr:MULTISPECIES: carboxypeptidase regulatory-like domain-containing protein [Hymenobacter]MBB4601335.1 hypothetical protein [Hymenobacter latericoloratus]MBB6058458.1 hypothetical protein [Hymenobacter luteus]